MKKLFSVFILLIFSFQIFADDNNSKDSTKTGPWQLSGVVGLNFSQVALSNWSQGGDNSIAYSLLGDFHFDYIKESWKLTNYLKLNWGRTKIGSDDSKVTDNEGILENVLSFNIDWTFDPYVSNTIRTVLVDGYDYGADPKEQVSAFFDPGYITQGLGLEYNKSELIKSRLGLGFKHTVTNKFNKYSDDPDTEEIEKYKLDTGIESVTELSTAINEILGFKSKLTLFGRFEDLGWWDVHWDNTLVAKVSKWFNFNINVLVVYDKVQTPKTQLKEAIQLGITYNLF